MDEQKLAEFRKRVIEDETYRHKFCDDPAAALKEVGIDVPAGTQLPKIDKAEMDDRVSKIRTSLGSNVKNLYSASSFKSFSTTSDFKNVQNLMDFSRTTSAGKIADAGTVYTISVCGTADI